MYDALIEGLRDDNPRIRWCHPCVAKIVQPNPRHTGAARDRLERARKAIGLQRPAELVAEHPEAYKDIDTVMANQADLVAIEHTLSQIFNYKD